MEKKKNKDKQIKVKYKGIIHFPSFSKYLQEKKTIIKSAFELFKLTWVPLDLSND